MYQIFQICDRGGGIPISRLENIFSYLYSTAPQVRLYIDYDIAVLLK